MSNRFYVNDVQIFGNNECSECKRKDNSVYVKRWQ